MPGKKTGLQRTYQIGDSDGVARYTGVTYGATAGEVKKPTADNAIPVGIVDNDERINDPLRAGGDQKGRDVAVQIGGYGAIKISGAVSYGDRLILATGGVAKKCPTAAGTYNIIGFAEEAGVDKDIIPVRMDYHVFTV